MLAREFRMAPQDKRGQIILTTHSPEFLNYFEPESIRFVYRENLETRIGLPSAEQIEALNAKDLFPGELLTVDPARPEEKEL